MKLAPFPKPSPKWGRFARLRVRPAYERDIATEKIAEEWLLIEWPDDENEPTKFLLSTLDATVTFTHLIHMTKMRWRIERDYLDLKHEVGLGYFEGRSWRGFHHHATLCIASYAFLVSERAAFSPRKRTRIGTSKSLPFPKVSAHGALPIRTERHVTNSIATLRRELIVGLAVGLPRGSCCAQPVAPLRFAA